MVQFHHEKPRPSADFDPLPPLLNKHYFERFPGHKFVFYHLEEQRHGTTSYSPGLPPDCHEAPEEGIPLINWKDTGCFVHPAWGKVLALEAAVRDYPAAEYILYVDNDAVINEDLYDHPLSVAGYYKWLDQSCGGLDTTPFIVGRDTEFWSSEVKRSNSVNTGTILFRNTAAAQKTLTAWADSVFDPYGRTDLIKSKDDPEQGGIEFRTDWPFDQFTLNRLATETRYHAGAGANLRTVPSSAELPLLVFFKKGSAPAGGADACEASVRADDAASVEAALRALGWVPTNVEPGSLAGHKVFHQI